MCEKIATAEMNRGEWLQLRKTGLGGSDAGAVCGLNPYSSPVIVFRDKTCEETEEQEGEILRQGRDLEDYVAQRFMEASGLKVRRSNFMYRSKEHPFMIADVDRLVAGEDAGLECKTVSAYSADQWKDGDIPLHYLIQCYHYMSVLNKKTWYIAAVILGRGFTYRKLVWDDDLIAGIIEAEKNFWYRHVVPGVIPDPDGSEICDEVLNQYFHTAGKKDLLKLTGFDEKLERREKIAAEIKKLQEEQKQIEQEVKLFMKDHERAANDRYRITWSNVSSAKLDVKRIKEEQPEIYRDYMQVSSYRRFQVRSA